MNTLGRVMAGAGAGWLASNILTPFNPFDTLPFMLLGAGAGAATSLFSRNSHSQMNQAYDPRLLGYQGGMNQFGGFEMPQGLMTSTVPQQGSGMGKFFKGAAIAGGVGLLAMMMMGGGGFGYPGYGFGMPFMGMGMGGMGMGMGGHPFGWMGAAGAAYATMPWIYGNGSGSMGMFGQSLGMGSFDWGVGLWR